MKTRFSYGRAAFSDESALAIAQKIALELAETYEDEDLAKIARGELEPEVPGCCDVNDAARRLVTLLARDILAWASLLEVEGDGPAQDLRACARWKVEQLVRGIYALEELLLERDHLRDDEEAPEGREVLEVAFPGGEA